MAWWRPLGTTKLSRGGGLALLLLVVSAMETTLVLSKKNDGIILLDSSKWIHYAWTYIPAFVVVCIGLYVTSMEFSLRLLDPFTALRSGGTGAFRGLFEDQLTGMLPQRIWYLYRGRRWGLLFASISAMLASMATIAVSDLLTLSGDPLMRSDFALLQLDGFNEARTYNWSDVWMKNITLPAWQFQSPAGPDDFRTDSYAFPHLSLTDRDPGKNINTSVLVTLPAARARLNCSFVDADCRNPTLLSPNTGAPMACTQWVIDDRVASSYLGSSGCMLNDLNKEFREMKTGCYDPSLTEPSGDLTAPTPLYRIPTREYLFGDIYAGWSRKDCPGILKYGREVHGDCESSHISFAICRPYVETIDVAVRFALPDFGIQKHDPVPPPESNAKAVNTVEMAKNTFQNSGQLWISIQEAENSPFSNLPNSTTNELSDTFLAIMSMSRLDRVTPEQIFSARAEDREKVMSSLEQMFMRPFSKALSDVLSNSTFDTPRTITGTLTDFKSRWLIQNEVSTRILQGLYGTIFICLSISFLLSKDMDKLLPFPPTSIGSLAKLLAGSKILGDVDEANADGTLRRDGIVPRGAERLTDEELERSGIFNPPRMFRLGWWKVTSRSPESGADQGPKRRFGIDFEVKGE